MSCWVLSWYFPGTTIPSANARPTLLMWSYNWVLSSPSIGQHSIHTGFQLPFYCLLTHSLQNYHSGAVLVPAVLNLCMNTTLSPRCWPPFSKSFENMLTITELQNSTGNLPVLPRTEETPILFHFLIVFHLNYSCICSFKILGNRPYLNNFGNPNILHLFPTGFNGIRKQKLSNFHFQTKQKEFASGHRPCFNLTIQLFSSVPYPWQ